MTGLTPDGKNINTLFQYDAILTVKYRNKVVKAPLQVSTRGAGILNFVFVIPIDSALFCDSAFGRKYTMG